MGIAVLTTYLTYLFHISFSVDLTLISIAMIFPLVFTIRGSFRRREKALEHLSQFRASLKTVHYFVMTNKELAAEDKEEFSAIIGEVSEQVMGHLKDQKSDSSRLDDVVHKVYTFVDQKEAMFSRGLRDKVFRFMNDLHESVENLNAIHTHRTPISLKAYCLVFIYIFPLIYAPTIVHNLGAGTSHWVTYFVVLVTQYILITLYNIQDKLEYPFDDDGLDDIKLENFKFNR